MKKVDRGEEYIQAFPKFKKWINECICCHRKGYNPAMPNKISEGFGAYYIRKYFRPLELDEKGLCAVCRRLLDDK